MSDLRLRLRRDVLHSIHNESSSSELSAEFVRSTVLRLAPFADRETIDDVVAGVLADLQGFGQLDELLSLPDVTDIMVVGGRGVWFERGGQLQSSTIVLDDDEILRLAERIVAPLGLRVDRASPMLDARLPDGSRINVVVPPLAVDGPCLTIRRFAARQIELADIAAPPVVDVLRRAVRERRNILISGGTGAGKTTLLNALAGEIGNRERIITVEDAAELRINLPHVVRLEGRPANAEGAGATSLRALVRNALRMRPDRIIVGEVRGPEALDMVQAMNTGHEGSMSTCHANSPIDALFRVETMVLMAEIDLPLLAVRQQIASTIDVIVQISRLENGNRTVTEVVELGAVSDDNQFRTHVLASQFAVVGEFTRPARLKGAA